MRPALLLVLAATLALAGCTPTEVAEAPGGAGGSGGSGGEALGDEDEFDPLTCLLGDWTISEAEMQKYYDRVSSGVEGSTFTVNGTTGLIFGDTDYSYVPAFTLEMDVSGTPATGAINGSISGNYVADGGEITTSNESNILSLLVDVAGFSMDGTELAQGILAESPVNSAPYECRPGPEVVIEMETGYGRVPIVLVPTE